MAEDEERETSQTEKDRGILLTAYLAFHMIAGGVSIYIIPFMYVGRRTSTAFLVFNLVLSLSRIGFAALAYNWLKFGVYGLFITSVISILLVWKMTTVSVIGLGLFLIVFLI